MVYPRICIHWRIYDYRKNLGELMGVRDFSTHMTNPFSPNTSSLKRDMNNITVFADSVAVIADLGARGITLLCYIMSNMKPGVYMIDLPRKEITKDPRYKSLKGGGYFVAVTDLLCHGIIARVDGFREYYYINQNIISSGNKNELFKQVLNREMNETGTK